MSDLSLNHDLYHEHHVRRQREAEAWTRRRALQRDARAARARISGAPSRRLRLIALTSPMVALGALLASGIVG